MPCRVKARRLRRLSSMTSATDRAKAASPRSLSGLVPFLRPYRGRIAAALVFLVAAAVTTLACPVALRSLVDQGLGLSGAAAAHVMARFCPAKRATAFGS